MNLVVMIGLTIGATAAIRSKVLDKMRGEVKGWKAFLLSVVVSAGVVAFSFVFPEPIPFVFVDFIKLLPQVVAGAFFGFQGLKIPTRINNG